MTKARWWSVSTAERRADTTRFRGWMIMAAALVAGALQQAAWAQSSTIEHGETRMVNAVVASIDGRSITLLEFKAYQTGRGRLLPASQRRSDSEFLDSMIEERLLESEFEQQGIAADDEDTQYYIDRILQVNNSSRADVERALKEIDLTWSDYFERMRFEVQKLALINREIRTRVHVTDEEVERYWRESGAAEEGAGMEISHIYLALPSLGVGSEAEEVRARAAEAYKMVQGGGFARAAKTYSQGPTAREGGKLGTFEHGTMAPVFEKQLMGLKEGEYTQPFEEGDGIHILRLDRVIEAGNRKELTGERREEIRDELYDKMLDERLQRWVREDLHKKHHVAVRLSHVEKLLDRSGAAPSSS
jgi:peptidyl-prolyl cis-trans isomerase SurA